MPAHRLLFYQTAAGHRPFADWLAELADANARARIEVRLNRLVLGSFGDCEPVGGGVLELRVSWGPGYRAYFARVGQEVVLLLCGGDKTSQQRDINRAKSYFEDYKARSAKGRPGRSV